MNLGRLHPVLQQLVRRLFAAVVLVFHVGVAQKDAVKSAKDKGIEFFERRICPILKQRCYPCYSHESGKAKGRLVLDSRTG